MMSISVLQTRRRPKPHRKHKASHAQLQAQASPVPMAYNTNSTVLPPAPSASIANTPISGGTSSIPNAGTILACMVLFVVCIGFPLFVYTYLRQKKADNWKSSDDRGSVLRRIREGYGTPEGLRRDRRLMDRRGWSVDAEMGVVERTGEEMELEVVPVYTLHASASEEDITVSPPMYSRFAK